MNEDDKHSKRPPGRQNLPSLDQALQYTPLTSILPFPPEIIQLPQAVPPSQPPSLLSASEQSTLDHTLNILNSHQVQINAPSSHVQRTLQDLSQIVDADNLPQYTINVPANLRSTAHSKLDHGSSEQTHSISSNSHDFGSNLTPFAKMALEYTPVRYNVSEHSFPSTSAGGWTNQSLQPRSGTASTLSTAHKQSLHPNYSSSSSSTLISHNSAISHQQRPTVVINPSPPLSNGINSSYQQHLELNHQQQQQHHNLPPTAAGQFAPMVVLPSVQSNPDESQYFSHPEIDAKIMNQAPATPKKRKRDDDELDSSLLTDHRDLADSAALSFQELLLHIFDAEDQLDTNDVSSASERSNGYFIVDRDSDGVVVALQSAMLASVDSAMSKVIKVKRFDRIPIEQVVHLQRLLLASLRLASEIPLQVPEDLSDDILDQWSSNIETAENSMRASRLLLTMMTSGRDEKELYSEEVTLALVNSLKYVLETGVLPLVERNTSYDVGKVFTERPGERSSFQTITQRSGRVLKLVGNLILLHDLSESMVTSIEYLATRIIFAENAATDKDSILGVQKFEVLRRQAMDVVSQVFLRHPEQRAFLLNEILSSLEKLPVTRQSARQFKLAEGKPIQLVSALIMQLVQTSSMNDLSERSRHKSSQDGGEIEMEENSDSSEQSDDSNDSSDSRRPKSRKPKVSNGTKLTKTATVSLLEEISAQAATEAQKNASHISRYLVQRALTSTKTGDQPYRNLLDIFTEDFLNVLSNPDWPAAEMLLRALLSHFLGIMSDEKSNAPAKNMALDLMGTIGAELAEVRDFVHKSFQNLDSSDLKAMEDIWSMFDDTKKESNAVLIIKNRYGPYRLLVETLQGKSSDNLQMQSAASFYISQWTKSICNTSPKDASGLKQEDGADAIAFDDVSRWLAHVIQSNEGTIRDRHFGEVSRTDARLCHAIILLTLPLLRATDRIFHSLVTALSSQQATVRSRSVKSVSQLLDKDPSILQRSNLVVARILQSASDPSPLVRDSAMTLVGKCALINPDLKLEAIKTLVTNSSDSSIAVRKRALKLLRDLYLENPQQTMRTIISDAILRRLEDIEESIAELANQTMEDIWLTPFHDTTLMFSNSSVQAQKSLQNHMALIAATVAGGEDISSSLESFFKHALKESEKNATANQAACKQFVSTLFEGIIDNAQDSDMPSQKSSLQTLTVFAKAEPQLFNAEQMLTLRPYIDNVSFTSEDLPIYRSTIAIYRRVLPVLPPLQKSFLLGIQEVLLNTISKLGRYELEEVAACLWIIDGTLENTERLVRLVVSVLRNISTTSSGSLAGENDQKRLRRLLMLAGSFGKACDFERHPGFFKNAFPSWKSGSVSSLIVDTLVPLAAVECPELIRETALDSIGLVCQAWPANYLKPKVSETFRLALEGGNQRLLMVVLSGFRSFYTAEDTRTKNDTEAEGKESATNGAKETNRLGKSMTVTHNDGAATSIAQQFLPKFLEIALSSYGSLALLATDIIASTNRQGLVHPKEVGAALVALETSPESIVAKAAFEEHQSLHSKHESVLEKEYIKAIEQAFAYQRNTFDSPRGVDVGFNPKLRAFYEVLKSGSVALRKKLFTNLCNRLVMDTSKEANPDDLDERLNFSRFLLENISLFDYGRVDELVQLISTMEKVFSSWGNPLSQRIESLISPQSIAPTVEAEAMQAYPVTMVPEPMATDSRQLRVATIESMVLSMIWQTRSFLRRIWGLGSLKASKGKSGAKDINKAPTRIANPPIEEHLEKIAQTMESLANEGIMINHCRSFLELLSVDNELKVESDEEGDGSRYETPSEDGIRAGSDLGSAQPTSGASKRGRKSLSVGFSTPSSTPRKPGRPPSKQKRDKSLLSMDYDDDEFIAPG